MCERCGSDNELIADGIDGATYICLSCGNSVHLKRSSTKDIDHKTLIKKWAKEMEEDLKKERGKNGEVH